MESQVSTTASPDSPDFEPSLTYGGTSGNVDVETSREATIHADMSGITNKAQRYVLTMAGMMREKGVTVAEVREKNGTLHHGRVSAALTNLHRDGRLVALKARRNRCGIYVLPEYAGERERRTFKPNRKPIDEEVITGVILDHRYKFGSVGGQTCECGWNPSEGDLSHVRHQAQKIAEALS
jgi:hypothetical protein